MACQRTPDLPFQIENLTQWVDPMIGTGGHGHTYPGASSPFGMVQLSPDTRLDTWDGCSGYHYSDSLIYGFSHTHLSGTGVGDYGDILLMPFTGDSKGNEKETEKRYASHFSHTNESATAGYYQVFLDDHQVKAELTTTQRTGAHRYHFTPSEPNRHIFLDLKHRKVDKVTEAYCERVNDSTIRGYRFSKGWAKNQRIYFYATFSQAFANTQFLLSDSLQPNVSHIKGEDVRAILSFNQSKNPIIDVRVGISSVDMDGAMQNLLAEQKGLDFPQLRKQATQAWNKELSRILIESPNDTLKRIFYTALYHACLNPNLFTDTNGRYRGMDDNIHLANKHTQYTVFSLWDTYRATHPLFTLIQQARTTDFLHTFLKQAQQGGALPIWELAGNYTGCMIGYHSIPVIADAYLKGIPVHEPDSLFEEMRNVALQSHLGLQSYRDFGFVAADQEGESVSKTLEYAYDDWCIAQMAKAMDKERDYQSFIRRAQYWKNVMEPNSHFMRARMNQAWYTPFDPLEVNYHFTEANAWQYRFYVPQDVSGLIESLGGVEAFRTELDRMFEMESDLSGRNQPDITGLIGQYAHGNEPSHHIAYLYAYCGQAWKTQMRVQEILQNLYSDQPDGLSGNEDCGQMSAWYVLSALGFYPVTPGSDQYVIGTPLFDRATIQLENGKRFVIEAKNRTTANAYIQSATWNGKPHTKAWISHAEIMKGGTLAFDMDITPNKDWASKPEDWPKSSIEGADFVCTPYLSDNRRTFYDSLLITLESPSPNTQIRYTLDGSYPTYKASVYNQAIRLDTSCWLNAIAVDKQGNESKLMQLQFHKIPEGRTIKLETAYGSQYAAGGDSALIDFIRGSDNFRTGAWQGYEGVDILAEIDLGQPTPINRLNTGFLQDYGSWIYFPLWVEYSLSTNGRNYETLGRVDNPISDTVSGAVLHDFALKTQSKGRYLRIRAKNRGVNPDWHWAAGGTSWIFADEIEIQ